MTNGLMMIQLKGASNKRVGGPPGANISDGPKGVIAPGLKALLSVDDISGIHGGGWGKFVGPRILLVNIERKLGLLQQRCL